MLKWFRSPIRGIALGLLLLMGVSANTTVAPQIGSGPSIRFRIQIPNGVQRGQVLGVTRQLVARGFDVAGLNLDTGAIDVISNQPGIDTLAKLGFKGVVISTSDTFSPDRRYLNPETLNSKMAALAGYSGGIAKVVNIGKTNQGRPLQALLLSTTLDVNSPAYFSKPTIIFDGLHHAREVMTPEIVLDVAEMLIKNQNRKFFNDILKSWNVWIVPMVNPDGSNIVWTSNSMWRKNARAGMASIYGVDVNRNYAYRWAECRGSSGNTGADDYRGTAAGSEPETTAMMGLADFTHPTASISYHSYSELVLYPYGCQGDFSSEKTLIQKIGQELAAQLPRDSGRGQYTPGTPWELLYSVDGSSMDYMYAAHGALAYTFEVNTDFHPSYELREPTLIKHRKAWTYFLNRISKNLLTLRVVDGKTNNPAEAQVFINTIEHKKKELPFRTNRAGNFFKVLDPGAYSFMVKLKDGRGAQIQINMNGQPQSALITVP